jgi:hypothetical protein
MLKVLFRKYQFSHPSLLTFPTIHHHHGVNTISSDLDNSLLKFIAIFIHVSPQEHHFFGPDDHQHSDVQLMTTNTQMSNQ